MRACFNILLIPYIVNHNKATFCIFKRDDMNIWQFIAGGGEKNESHSETALREFVEESGLPKDELDINKLVKLDSVSSVSIEFFPELKEHYKGNMFVIPIYCFAYDLTNVNKVISLSHEHTEYKWVDFQTALDYLHFDLDKTALRELFCKIPLNRNND